MATFEERLTKLRTKAGVSQQAIGDALNVPCWNCNRSNIAIDTSEQEQIEPVDKLGESL